MRPEIEAAVAAAGANWHRLWNNPNTRADARALLVALWPKVGETIPALSRETGIPVSTLKLWRRSDELLREGTPTKPGRRYPKGAASDGATAANEQRRRASGE